jgi:histidine triad (HIT) family protein
VTGYSVRLPDDDRCAFCAYLSGDRPFTILSRTEMIATLVTREQRGVAHLLVIPIHHVPTIFDLADGEASALMIGVREAARLIDRAEQRPGIAVWQNNGVSAGQAISHVHFHVAGTLPGGNTHRDQVPELSVADTDKIARRLLDAASM